MDHSQHTVTKYLNDEKTPVALSKLFEKLNHMNIALYAVELTKAEIEHKQSIIVGFFILQYAEIL